jgi:DNA-binding NtrC family response regulator
MSSSPSPEAVDRVALIVDDEADIRDVLSELLVDLGWKVQTAASCDRALDTLEENVRDVTVVIADYLMPGKTGIDFLREIRARGLLTPVVFFPANGVPNALVEAIRLGAADFCDKSTDFSTLLNAAEKAHLKWQLVLKNARALAEVTSSDLSGSIDPVELSVDLEAVYRKHLRDDRE